ncbi:MAG: flavodoxin reductase [Saprospiraceae bacterium]
MTQHPVKILSLQHVTHDVLQVVTMKPPEYTFHPGQATDVSINKPDWKDELRPFTFTCLPEDDHLEFTIKTYPERKSVTNELLHLKKDDELILHDVFGDIGYVDEGVFIAGGAGVTPFISIFRYLYSKNKIGDNKLIFANKTKADIIHEEEFRKMLGKNFINILSDEKTEGYAHGYITKDFIKIHINSPNSHFYVCGPPPLMDAVEKQLADLGIDEKMIIREGF